MTLLTDTALPRWRWHNRDQLGQEVYSFVCSYKLEHDGCAPTAREIGAVVNLAPSGVMRELRRLRAAGLLDFVDGQERSIRVTGGHWSAPVEIDL